MQHNNTKKRERKSVNKAKRRLFSFLLAIPLSLFANTQAPLPPEQASDQADIYLNFEKASLASVVNYLAEQRKLNIIPHKDLAAKQVSLTTRNPLTLNKAWDVLLTLLEMNNFTIINVDNVYRIVPSNTNKQEPLPLYSVNKGTQPEDLPESDLVIRYVYLLKNIKTSVAKTILGDLIGADKIQINEDLATLIITAKSNNIKSAMKIIKELDTGGLRESIKIVKLRYTDPETIKKLFTESIMGEDDKKAQQKTIRFLGPKEKSEMTYFSKTTRIITETRHNALILLGQEQNISRIIEFIQKYLDIPMKAAESRLHVKELKYVKAKEIETILITMTKPPSKGKSSVEGEFRFFEDVTIKAETGKTGETDKEESRGSGNRLIIACNKDDWRRLEKFIDKLDKPQPQVALEVMIVDIDEVTTRKLGTQIREKAGKSFAKGMTAFTANLASITTKAATGEDSAQEYDPNLIANADGPQGTTVATIGNDTHGVWGVIKTFFSSASTNVISQPFMITSNNKECILEVTHTKRVPGKFEKTSGGTTTRKLETVNAHTTLKITPRINVGGLVDLKINIDLGEFLAAESDDRPPRSTRNLITRTNIATGEVLVLGGLTKSRVTDNRYKTPLFGDIPIIGNLFKHKEKAHGKTNLFVFIRPSIIKPNFEGGADEYTQLKLDYAKYQILNAEEMRATKDPIQRWFFKPDKRSVSQTVADLEKGIYRPLDNYAEGQSQPNSVRIERDPYYRASEEIEKLKGEEEAEREKAKHFKQPLPSLRKRNRS